MADLIAFLRAQLDDDEMWARGANRAYEYAKPPAVPPDSGVHWQWVIGEDWEPVAIDPALNEFVAEPGDSCNLVTVEEWPANWHRPMPHAYANSIVEMDSTAAGHIARWDPARVLAEVEAKRRILHEHEHEEAHPALMPHTCRRCGSFGWCLTVRLLALPFSDRPGYDETWRPA